MNFYGVGVQFGGAGKEPIDMFDYFRENTCWFMGFDTGVKPDLDRIINDIPIGSIIVAKSYATYKMQNYYIRGLGIVTGKELPDKVKRTYPNKNGVTVIWFKYFPKEISLLSKDYKRGTFHTSTIFCENNKETMIPKIKEIMNFDYKGEA